MANTPLDKVKYKKADGSYSDNQPDVEKSDVNVDPSVSHLNKVQAGELMQLFEKTNNAIEQINKFIGTFNNEGNVDGIAQDQGIKWDASANKFVKTPLQTTTFDPKVIKVKNSLWTKVGLDIMDGTTDDKTLVSKGEMDRKNSDKKVVIHNLLVVGDTYVIPPDNVINGSVMIGLHNGSYGFVQTQTLPLNANNVRLYFGVDVLGDRAVVEYDYQTRVLRLISSSASVSVMFSLI